MSLLLTNCVRENDTSPSFVPNSQLHLIPLTTPDDIYFIMYYNQLDSLVVKEVSGTYALSGTESIAGILIYVDSSNCIRGSLPKSHYKEYYFESFLLTEIFHINCIGFSEAYTYSNTSENSITVQHENSPYQSIYKIRDGRIIRKENFRALRSISVIDFYYNDEKQLIKSVEHMQDDWNLHDSIVTEYEWNKNGRAERRTKTTYWTIEQDSSDNKTEICELTFNASGLPEKETIYRTDENDTLEFTFSFFNSP